MGTRNLTAVVIDGEYKVAQYGQWDGYPSGQGLTILGFLREADINRLKTQVNQCRSITDEEHKARWIQAGADPNDESGLVTMDVASKHKELYPESSRDTAGKILKLIYNSENGLLLNIETNFAADSLFCEWCYVVDLDKGTLEVFEGFNKKSLSEDERFYFLQKDGKDFFPVRHLHTFPLDSLPSDEDFISILCPPNEGEENEED